MVEYEPDTDLRDTEQVPLLEDGRHRGLHPPRGAAARAGCLVSTRTSVKIGYEISFTRYFYKPQPLRTLEEIRADILALETETEGLLAEIIGSAADDRRPQAVSGVSRTPACRGSARCRSIGSVRAGQAAIFANRRQSETGR